LASSGVFAIRAISAATICLTSSRFASPRRVTVTEKMPEKLEPD
jgi:hypothetical protein